MCDKGWTSRVLFQDSPDLLLQRSDACSVLCPALCGPQEHHRTSLGLPCGKGLGNLSLLPPSPGLAAAPLARQGLLCTPRHHSLGVPVSSTSHPGPKSGAHPTCAAASQTSTLPSRRACWDAARRLEDTGSAADGPLSYVLLLVLKEELS